MFWEYRFKTSSKLISEDNHNNTANIKVTFLVEIAPVCKDDLVIIPKELALHYKFSDNSNVAILSKVTSQIHIRNPFTDEQ